MGIMVQLARDRGHVNNLVFSSYDFESYKLYNGFLENLDSARLPVWSSLQAIPHGIHTGGPFTVYYGQHHIPLLP